MYQSKKNNPHEKLDRIADTKASYEAKSKAFKNRYQAGQGPSQFKVEAKKTAIKHGVRGAATAAGVPVPVTETVLESRQGDEILTEAAAASSIEEGIEIVVKKLVVQQSQKLILYLVVLILAPFMLILLMLSKYTDGFSYIQGEKLEGYQRLYDAIELVESEIKSKYDLNINKYLIISTMTALMSNEEYSNEKDTIIDVDSIDSEGSLISLSVSQLENKARLLAMYQIVTARADCSRPSSTPRQIAANDDANYFFFANAVNKEKNYHCGVSEDSYYISYLQGSIDDDSSGGVFYWNLIDDNFLEEYYVDEFKALKSEEKLAKKAEIVDYIYLYAKILEDGDVNVSHSGVCEYDHIMVRTYECSVGANPILGQKTDAEIPGRMPLEVTPFEDYVIGVVMLEGGVYNKVRPNYTKAQAIASRTYALSRANWNPSRKVINLRACVDDQIHCNYKTGCSKGKSDEGGSKESGTYYPGLISGLTQRAPVTDQEWLNILEEVRGVVVKDPAGNFIPISYRASEYTALYCRPNKCMLAQSAIQDDKNGMDYEAILRKYFSDYELVFSSSCSGIKDSLRFGERGLVLSGDSSYVKTHFISNVNSADVEIEFDGVKLNTSKNSSGPAALAMIVNALSKDFNPLFDYFAGEDEPYARSKELQVVTMMHRYLYKISQQEEFGSSKYTTYDNRAVGIFNIKSLGEKQKGSFSKEQMIKNISEGRVILANIKSSDCPVGTDTCQGLGSSSSNSFAVIFGYNKANDTFMVHNPSSFYGAYGTIDASLVETKISSITVYEALPEED